MDITKEDQNLIILSEGNLLPIIIGILFGLMGFAIILKPDFFTNQPPLWSGFLSIISGVFIIFVAQAVTITLDKRFNKLSVLRKSLVGESIKQYELDQIKEVELSSTLSSSSKGGGYSYHLALSLNSGEAIPLNPGRSSVIKVMGRQIIPEKAVGEKIASFLNVPFQEKKPLTASGIMSAVKGAAEREIEKRRNK